MQQKWDTSVSVTAGIKSSIEAKIPLLGKFGVELSSATTIQFTEGTTVTDSVSHSVSVEHNVSVRLVGHKYKAGIPFNARLSRTYDNGETRWTFVTGMYDSVQIGEVQADVKRCEPLPNAKPCPSKG